MKPTSRSIAVDILDKVLLSESETVKNILPVCLSSAGLSQADKSLLTELVYGVLRHLNALDWFISNYSKHKTIAPRTKNILRSGAYQLIYLDKIPSYAAINESVEMAKISGAKTAGFVNAVLRKIAGGKKEILPDDFKGDFYKYLSVRYSFPEWLINKWKKVLSGEELIGFLEASNEIPLVSLRVNTLKISAEDLKKSLRERKISFLPGSHPLIIRITSNISLETLDLFKNGYFFVQDEATLRVVDLLDPKPGENILDLCSAPGGKAAYMAQTMGNHGRILAVDNNTKRLKLVEENAKRMNIAIIEPYLSDVLELDAFAGIKYFDRVLLDAPCSNQGVLSKRVEARWRIRPKDIRRLSMLQLKMLINAAQFVKPGGRLVYSTCSIDCDEDEMVIENFLAGQKIFSLENMFKTWPHLDRIDGTFAASLRKN